MNPQATKYLKVTYTDKADGQQKEETIPVKIVRSARRTIGISVDEEAEVTLRLPRRASQREGMKFAYEKRDWILSKVLLQRQKKQEREKAGSQLSPAHERALKKRYVQAAHEYFPKRCAYYADLLGVTYKKIRIAEQKTRWGSCSSAGTLSFNWKLMLAPMHVLDYVVVHELCHLKEMNHSPAFWALVEGVMPEYKEYRKWLKENGDALRLS